jgi:hypothetical protein
MSKYIIFILGNTADKSIQLDISVNLSGIFVLAFLAQNTLTSSELQYKKTPNILFDV